MQVAKYTWATLLTSVLVSGCPQIPAAELTQYKQAFAQVQDVSEKVLLDYDQALRESQAFMDARKPAAETPAPYPLVWDDKIMTSDKKKVDGIEVRRLAFQVIGKYNNLLTQLAEGKSVEQVRNSATSLMNAISAWRTLLCGTGVPGLPAIVDGVSLFSDLLEKARLRQEFTQAVEKGAPLISKMLDVMMVDDLKAHYQLRITRLHRDRINTVAAMRSAQEAISGIVAQRHLRDADANEAAGTVNRHLATVRTELAVYPVRIVQGGPKMVEYSPTDKAQVQDEQATLAHLADEYQSNLQAARALASMLQEYRMMLAKTQDALNTLAKSLDAPTGLTVDVDALLESAFRLKRDIEELRTAKALP